MIECEATLGRVERLSYEVKLVVKSVGDLLIVVE